MRMRPIALQLLAIGVLSAAVGYAQTPAPCALLTVDEVRRVFPDAQAGKPDRRNEQHGTFACEWAHKSGRLMIIAGEEHQSPAEEARSWVDSFADPLNSGAVGKVRFETITGVGDAAVAVVETADNARGFMQDSAYIVVRRGKQQVMVSSTDVAKRGRPAALAVLTELGRAVAARLK